MNKTNEQTSNDDWYSITRAARLTETTRQNIYMHIKRGNVEATYFDNAGMWMIEKSELDRFMRSGRFHGFRKDSSK